MDDQLIRDRALRLFTFLKDLTELSTKTVLTLDGYEKVLWFNDIPKDPPGSYCIAWPTQLDQDEQEDTWIEVKKPNLLSPPKPTSDLFPWLDPNQIDDSSREFPELRERISVEVQRDDDLQAEFHELKDFPRIQSLWEQYVERQWKPWAANDRKLQVVQTIYTDLFSIYQKQQRLGEAYEVVVGIGYLTWKTSSGKEIARHIIAAQTSLEFDAKRGIVTVSPAGEGAKPRLEEDMLDPQERPGTAERQGLEQTLNEMGDDGLWDRSNLFSVLKSWTQAISSRSRFAEDIIPQADSKQDPQVHFAPAIILRKRTERSLLRIFEEICQQLKDGIDVPIGIKRLVTIVEDKAEATDGRGIEGASTSSDAGEIYFPLLSNDQQQQIAKKLAAHHGVLVQGPPGTGKSHTIANLICHLLATGQRVLITSHSSRALRALLDRFSQDVDLKEIAGLCVILLGDDLQAMQALENSVATINQQYKDWDNEANLKRIAELEEKLEQARREESETLSRLRGIREGEIYNHKLDYGLYSGSAQKIAARLRQETPKFSWVELAHDIVHDPPLSDEHCRELLFLLRDLSGDKEQEASLYIVGTESLMHPGEFDQLVANLNRISVQYKDEQALRTDTAYQSLCRVPSETRKLLVEQFSELITLFTNLTRDPRVWVNEAAKQVLGERDRAWRELLNLTQATLTKIKPKVTSKANLRITGLGSRDLAIVRAQAEQLALHIKAGKRLGLGPFRAKAVKEARYLLREVHVDGKVCRHLNLLQDLIEWIEIGQNLDILRSHWSRHVEAPAGQFLSQIAEYEDLCEPLELALNLHARMQELKQIIKTIPNLRQPIWQAEDDLLHFQKLIDATVTEETLNEINARFSFIEENMHGIRNKAPIHPECERLAHAIRQRDPMLYRQVWEALAGLRRLRELLERRKSLLDALKGGAASQLANRLIASHNEPHWDDKLSNFVAAWNWARANNWLRSFTDRTEESRMARKLEQCRLLIRELTRDLAGAKAWRHCMAKLSSSEREHLQAWALAVRRIGKGKGKYAPKHRKAAREHMEQCRSAIPAWIMPIYRVAESIRPGADSFDVVIVDEASQSGPEALFLNFLAKKIVVVGDDKQISPEFVGITREDVEVLRQRYLSDIPHNDALGVDNSFFDQAMIRFPGAIRLREHFRCMPEIIQFSNNLCYRSEPLIPLRQYGIERLAPVISTNYVHNGYQKGHSPRVTNPPEADAIVEAIKKCCDNPAYKGKSIGVISLLGEQQARLIERRLLNCLSPEEIEARNIVCGDAYAFQGTERDVMFLSLVSAPMEGSRIGTLASPRDERRFNVAASRARDQMWLFHSCKLTDLSQHCLRYRLLEYCLSPKVEPLIIAGLDVKELASLALTVDRERETPPNPFDSWFEVDVFLKIVDRGYRVIPQLNVAGYKIDLVVEGMRGRLAVECDGDAWHGIEKYEQDMARERMLIRCGWVFWRVRGSAFYRDPDGVLGELWEKLSRLQIMSSSQGFLSTATMHKATGSSPIAPELDTIHPEKVSKPSEADVRSQDDDEENELEEGGEESDQLELHEEEPIESSQASLFLPSGFLAPYTPWLPKSQLDPRTAPLDNLILGLVDIINTEGPIPCHRVYRLYVKAAGIQKVGRQIKSILNKAIRKTIRQGIVEEANEEGTNDQVNRIVRKRGAPSVVPRMRGDRSFHEIPPGEIAAAMKAICSLKPDCDDNYLFQAVIKSYGFGRLTTNIRERLMRIKAILQTNHTT